DQLNAGAGEEMDWDDHVDAVRKVKEVQDCEFVRMVGFSLREPSVWPFARRAKLEIENSDVTLADLIAGRSYDLRFALHSSCLERHATLPIDIAVRGQHVEVSEPVAYQRGSGAIVSFLLA